MILKNLYTQTDKRWRDDSMAIPKDKLWRWGCLVTCISNILSDRFKTDITPGMLNTWLRNNSGYLGKEHRGSESVLLWNTLEKEYNFKHKRYVTFKDDKNKYYIGVVLHNLTKADHFINVLDYDNDLYLCFDVETGKVLRLKKHELVELRGVYFE